MVVFVVIFSVCVGPAGMPPGSVVGCSPRRFISIVGRRACVAVSSPWGGVVRSSPPSGRVARVGLGRRRVIAGREWSGLRSAVSFPSRGGVAGPVRSVFPGPLRRAVRAARVWGVVFAVGRGVTDPPLRCPSLCPSRSVAVVGWDVRPLPLRSVGPGAPDRRCRVWCVLGGAAGCVGGGVPSGAHVLGSPPP